MASLDLWFIADKRMLISVNSYAMFSPDKSRQNQTAIPSKMFFYSQSRIPVRFIAAGVCYCKWLIESRTVSTLDFSMLISLLPVVT